MIKLLQSVKQSLQYQTPNIDNFILLIQIYNNNQILQNSNQNPMNNYKGEVRRPLQRPSDRPSQHTPTKSSWQNDRNNFEQVQQEKYSKNRDFQKSQLSYYQSQATHTIYDNTNQMNVQSKLRLSSTNQNKELYDNLIPIKVQSVDKQQYSTYLRIQIVNTIEKGSSKLTVYLTDDRDPKFLWLFFIKENDFLVFKKQQKLRVDFRGFPNMLMDHFDMCKSQKQAANSINMGQCYFFCLFEIKKNQGSLNILQANKYKQSVHLSLKCKLGNDEQIKQYLSDKLLKSQSQNSNLRSKISSVQQLLSTRKQEIQRLQVQLKQQRKFNQQSSSEFEIQMNKIKTQLKKQKIENEQKLKKNSEKQYNEMKQTLEEQLRRYTKSYDQLKTKYQNIQQKVTVLESKQRQSSFDLSTKSKQIETYIRRLQQQKSYTSQLQCQKQQNQKSMLEQKMRIESLQSQMNDKLKIIQSNHELKSTNSHQINSLQSKNQEYRQQVQKHEAKIKSLEDQVNKLQTSLQDYRDKCQKRKQKITERNSIIKEQQRQITSKQNEIIELKRQLVFLDKQMEGKKLDNDDKERRILQFKRQIEECQRKIKEDNDLVSHLQKQLNQRTIGLRSGYGTSSYQRSTSPFTSNVSNKQYIPSTSSIGANNTSTSRLKFTSTGNQNEQVTENRGTRKQIDIKRYTVAQDFINRERSKSPIINSRLNQQKDPEEMMRTTSGMSNNNGAVSNTGIVKPVKFKYSQRE